MAAHDNAFTNRMAKLMVAGAVFAAAIYAIDLGFARAANWYLAPAIVIGLLCVVIGEILAWHNAAMACHERRAGSMLLWAALAMICSAGTLYTNFSTSASNQDEKSSVQLTAFTSYEDLDKTEDELTRKVKELDEKLRLAPVETAEAYDAKIENFKSHKFWKYTDECRKTKGNDSRKFCSEYSSAVANKSNATGVLTLREDRKAAATELIEVRNERKTVKAVISDDTPGVTLVANMTGDKAMARQLDSMAFPLLVQAIMFFGGILLANETARNMVRKPWIDWKRVGYRMHWIAAALTFKPLPPLPNSSVVHNHPTDHAYARAINARMSQIGAPA